MANVTSTLEEEELSLFDESDPEWDAKRDAEADADIAAGRVVPNEAVVEWLKTWGTPDYKPMRANGSSSLDAIRRSRPVQH